MIGNLPQNVISLICTLPLSISICCVLPGTLTVVAAPEGGVILRWAALGGGALIR